MTSTFSARQRNIAHLTNVGANAITQPNRLLIVQAMFAKSPIPLLQADGKGNHHTEQNRRQCGNDADFNSVIARRRWPSRRELFLMFNKALATVKCSSLRKNVFVAGFVVCSRQLVAKRPTGQADRRNCLSVRAIPNELKHYSFAYRGRRLLNDGQG